MTPASATPIFSDGLDAALKKAVDAIPTGKTRQVTLGASFTGAEVSASWKTPWTWVLSGYAEKLWGAGGYQAGVRAQAAW